MITQFMCTSCEIDVRWLPQKTYGDVNIGSGNDLVPLGNKPLPEPMLSQTYVITWRHWTEMS